MIRFLELDERVESYRDHRAFLDNEGISINLAPGFCWVADGIHDVVTDGDDAEVRRQMKFVRKCGCEECKSAQ